MWLVNLVRWTPIGAEQTASGYLVAWKMAGADQYSVWVTDSNGNYLSNTLTSVSGTSARCNRSRPVSIRTSMATVRSVLLHRLPRR